jgi:PadR family transcriptional regulator, regulatory protein PadR
MGMDTNDAVLTTHIQEIRRGTVVLAVLALLHEPGYGYALLESLEEAGIGVDANTLYPLLRRLEKQGLLTSDWDTEGGRPRKYYRSSDLGKEILGVLAGEWERLDESVTAILQKGGAT